MKSLVQPSASILFDFGGTTAPFTQGSSSDLAPDFDLAASGEKTTYGGGFPSGYASTGNHIPRLEINRFCEIAGRELFFRATGGNAGVSQTPLMPTGHTFNADVSAAVGGYPAGALLDWWDGGAIRKVESQVSGNSRDFNDPATPYSIDAITMPADKVLWRCATYLDDSDFSDLSWGVDYSRPQDLSSGAQATEDSLVVICAAFPLPTKSQMLGITVSIGDHAFYLPNKGLFGEDADSEMLGMSPANLSIPPMPYWGPFYKKMCGMDNYMVSFFVPAGTTVQAGGAVMFSLGVPSGFYPGFTYTHQYGQTSVKASITAFPLFAGEGGVENGGEAS